MNLIKRILSGVIYIALIVTAILLLDNSPVMYLLVFPLLIVLGISEMVTMAKEEETQSWLVNIIDMLGGVGLFVAFYLHYEGTTVQSRALWLLPIAIYLLLRTIVQLYRPRSQFGALIFLIRLHRIACRDAQLHHEHYGASAAFGHVHVHLAL